MTVTKIKQLLLTFLILVNLIVLLKPDCAYSVSASFPKTDAVLMAQIQAQIAQSPALAPLNIHLEVSHGAVTLKGMVYRKEQAIALIILAESIAGVQSVDVADLSLGKSKLNSDIIINSMIIGTFNREGLMGPLSRAPVITTVAGPGNTTYANPPPPINIQVKTKNKIVYLSGSAPSQAEVDKAISLARSIPGVVDVKSTITSSR